MQNNTLPIFHFLLCQLIQQCFTNYKQDGYFERLKQIGSQIGFRMYNQIAIKRYVTQRIISFSGLAKFIQTKVFKYLFNYQASDLYSATAGQTQQQPQKQYYQVIVDTNCVYLTWMPEYMWNAQVMPKNINQGVPIFISGIIEGILTASGLKCSVLSQAKLDKTDTIEAQYRIKIGAQQFQKWNKQ